MRRPAAVTFPTGAVTHPLALLSHRFGFLCPDGDNNTRMMFLKIGTRLRGYSKETLPTTTETQSIRPRARQPLLQGPGTSLKLRGVMYPLATAYSPGYLSLHQHGELSNRLPLARAPHAGHRTCSRFTSKAFCKTRKSKEPLRKRRNWPQRSMDHACTVLIQPPASAPLCCLVPSTPFINNMGAFERIPDAQGY